MIYLRTGANGAGKTLLTLKEVREKSLAENRPVVHNGRFRLKADFGWKQADVKEWQKEPDGTIFLVDEAQNDFPICDPKALPEYMKMMAEHRVRGFDFYMLTQHPLNINAFVRRLIGPPGWHQHLKRASGSPLVSVIQWGEVNSACEKPGAGSSGSVKMVAYPKEVYDWYESTTLDTAKLKIPFRVWLLGATLILVPAAIYFAVSTFRGAAADRDAQLRKMAGGQPGSAAVAVVSPSGGVGAATSRPMTTVELASSYVPRLAGIPATAPRYDSLTVPTEAPALAACISGTSAKTKKHECRCYTQQATIAQVDSDLCEAVAANGHFQDWHNKDSQRVVPASPPAVSPAPRPPVDVLPPVQPPETVAAAVLHEARPPDRGHSDGQVLRSMTRPPAVNVLR